MPRGIQPIDLNRLVKILEENENLQQELKQVLESPEKRDALMQAVYDRLENELGLDAFQVDKNLESDREFQKMVCSLLLVELAVEKNPQLKFLKDLPFAKVLSKPLNELDKEDVKKVTKGLLQLVLGRKLTKEEDKQVDDKVEEYHKQFGIDKLTENSGFMTLLYQGAEAQLKGKWDPLKETLQNTFGLVDPRDPSKGVIVVDKILTNLLGTPSYDKEDPISIFIHQSQTPKPPPPK